MVVCEPKGSEWTPIRVQGFSQSVYGADVEWFPRLTVVFLIADDDGVHVRPEIVGPAVLEGGVDEEILHLGESEESRSVDDVHAEDLGQAMVVDVKRVLRRQQAIAVTVHDACVLDHIDVFRGPAGDDVADNHLLQEAPIASEAYEERGGLVDVRGGWTVPFWDWGKVCGGVCGGGEREVVDHRRGRGEWRFMEDWRGTCRFWGARVEVFEFGDRDFTAEGEAVEGEEGGEDQGNEKET